MSEPLARPKIVLLIDDVRSFADGRACHVARTSEAAVTLLRTHQDVYIDEVWLDWDLAGRQSTDYTETAMPAVDELAEAAAEGAPYDIGIILLHTSNPRGGVQMLLALERAQYSVRRYYGRGWVHRQTEVPHGAREPLQRFPEDLTGRGPVRSSAAHQARPAPREQAHTTGGPA